MTDQPPAFPPPTTPEPEAPLPEGYTARAASGADIEAAVELFNAYSQAFTGKDNTTVEAYEKEWKAPFFSLRTDTRLVFAPDGQLAAIMEVWDTDPAHAEIWASDCIHPDHKGLSIEAHLLEWAENRARESLPEVPAGQRVVLISEVLGQDNLAQDALLARDYGLARTLYRLETRFGETLPEDPAWPRRVKVRLVEPESDVRALVEASREAFADHWSYVEQPFETELAQWERRLNDPEVDLRHWFAATHEREIVGLCLGMPNHPDDDPDLGWISTIAVRPAWRGQGIGLALLRTSFMEFFKRGKAGVWLGVDVPGDHVGSVTAFFEKAGMRVAGQYLTFAKTLQEESAA